MAWPKGKKRGQKPPTSGRKPGTPNARTEAIRLAVVKSFDHIGGWKYLVKMAEAQPAAYMTLLGKLLPPEQPAPASGNNVLVLRWVTPEIAQARGMIETTANKEPGQD